MRLILILSMIPASLCHPGAAQTAGGPQRASAVQVQAREGATNDPRRAIEQTLQQKLDELHSQADFPGASLAVVLPNGDLVTATTGYADVEAQRAMEPAGRFMSASIGKTYFAAMALQLAGEGKLDLDAHVSQYLGQRAWFDQIPNADSLTVRQLMRHQSGIPRWVFERQVWEDALQDPDRTWTPGDRLSYILGKKPLHPAGEGWAYSDTNYILLGMILQQVSGSDVYDYVSEHFLKPHGLRDTRPNDRRRLPGLVQGYARSFKALGVPDKVMADGQFVFNPAMEWCGGGFYSTAADLARWAGILFSGRAIERKGYVQAMTDGAADCGGRLGPDSRYGLGVIIRPTSLGPLLGHDGGFPGYTATMGYYPEQGMAGALMFNTDGRMRLPAAPYAVMTEFIEVAAGQPPR